MRSEGIYTFVGLHRGASDDKKYLTFVSSWQRYQPFKIGLIENITLATRLKAGLIQEFGKTKSIPVSDLFFAGGATTVRGYDEQLLGPSAIDKNGNRIALGGKMVFISNVEFRIPVYWLFIGEIFIDAGNVWRELYQFSPLDVKISYGAGIAFITPIGPIRFDYGIKLKPEKSEDDTAFHLGFYFAF